MSTHTPGPWTRVGATRIWKTGKDGGAVAIVVEPNAGTSRDFVEVDPRSKRFDEAMANARLIVAAPDLLLLLKAIAADVSAYQWHRAVNAAIAKTEGR